MGSVLELLKKANCGIVVHSWFWDTFVMSLEVDLKLFEAALSRFCTSAAGGDPSTCTKEIQSKIEDTGRV